MTEAIMPRKIEILLGQRGVRAIADLMEEEAPKTCDAVWNALPKSGPVHHAKWANNEIYILTAPFAAEEPGRENATVFPIPGDLLYFFISPGGPVPPDLREQCAATGLIDLAIFYGRNNYLHGPEGHMPGNLFATITEGLNEFAVGCQAMFRNGMVNERLTFRRVEE
jgi:Protein of unknown function (DUF3830)